MLNFHYTAKLIRCIFRMPLCVAWIIFLFLYCWDVRWVETPQCCSQLYNYKCAHTRQKQKEAVWIYEFTYQSIWYLWEFWGWNQCDITRCINIIYSSSVGLSMVLIKILGGHLPKSWSQWSLWIPSNLECSVALWFIISAGLGHSVL